MTLGYVRRGEGDREAGRHVSTGLGKVLPTHTHSRYLSTFSRFLSPPSLSLWQRGHNRSPPCVADVFHEQGGQLGCSCPNRRALGRGGEELRLEGAGDGALGKGQTPQDSFECGNCPRRHVQNALRYGIVFLQGCLKGEACNICTSACCMCENCRWWAGC